MGSILVTAVSTAYSAHAVPLASHGEPRGT